MLRPAVSSHSSFGSSRLPSSSPSLSADHVCDFAADVGGEHEFAVAEQLATDGISRAGPEHGAAERIDALQFILILKDDAARRDRAERAAARCRPRRRFAGARTSRDRRAAGAVRFVRRAYRAGANRIGGKLIGRMTWPEYIAIGVRRILPRIDRHDLAAERDRTANDPAGAVHSPLSRYCRAQAVLIDGPDGIRRRPAYCGRRFPSSPWRRTIAFRGRRAKNPVRCAAADNAVCRSGIWAQSAVRDSAVRRLPSTVSNSASTWPRGHLKLGRIVALVRTSQKTWPSVRWRRLASSRSGDATSCSSSISASWASIVLDQEIGERESHVVGARASSPRCAR